MKTIVQAGGKGTRLRPYTLVLPKPLIPVGDHPVIHHLLRWLRRNGMRQVFITTGHLGELIRSLCGDGSRWDLEITYTEEVEPLGTLGAVSLLRSELQQPFLVVNGDLLTDLDLGAFRLFHNRHKGLLTVAVTERTVATDLGVLHVDGARVVRFQEKPRIPYLASIGVYCMSPELLRFFPNGAPFGFDDLMNLLLSEGEPVYTFKHEGAWIDIGREEDFFRAQQSAEGYDPAW